MELKWFVFVFVLGEISHWKKPYELFDGNDSNSIRIAIEIKMKFCARVSSFESCGIELANECNRIEQII